MKVRITIDLTTDHLEWVTNRCKKENLSRNALIAKMIDNYKHHVNLFENEEQK